MGALSSKSKSQHLPRAYPFEQKLAYYTDEVNDFAALQFRKPMLNLQFLSRDILRYIFATVREIAFLGKVSRVCQLWYTVSCEDMLWERLLVDQKRNDLSRSGRAEAYHQWYCTGHVCLPYAYKQKIETVGYNLPARERESLIRIVIMGAPGVGKSALTVQFVQGIFVEKYDPTIEDVYRVLRKFHNQHILYEILDTAATEHLDAMRDPHILRNGDGYCVLFSVTSRQTFDDVKRYLKDVYHRVDIDDKELQFVKSVIIVGTKTDLPTSSREVSYSEGCALAKEWNVGYIEISSKSNSNVDVLFMAASELAMMCRTIAKDENKRSKPQAKD